MTERDGYQHGVPCWVDTWQPDAEAAVRFYAELFGWEAAGGPVPGSSRQHFICRVRDRQVAAIGSPPPDGLPPAWGTYMWVDDADGTAAKVTAAGGRLLMEPFDSLDGGRMAVAADPSGAAFGLWQPGTHKGAQVVNEAGAWSWSQLFSNDPQGVVAFYREVLGWDTVSFGEGEGATTLFRVPGYFGGEPQQPVSRDVVAGVAPLPNAETPPHWQIDFWVGDVDATVATATRLGATAVVPPYDTPIARQAVLADPQGAVFSISKITIGAP